MRLPIGRSPVDGLFFHVVEHERTMNALRCRWDGNDKDKFGQMLEGLAVIPAIQWIEPDPRVSGNQKP